MVLKILSPRYISIILASILFIITITYFLRLYNQTSTSSVLSTSWPTFTHATGYSFQYPPTLKVTQLNNSNTVLLRSTEEKELSDDYEFDATIRVLNNANQLPLEEFIKKNEGIVNGQIPATGEYSGDKFIRKIIAFQEKSIDDHQAYFFHADPCSICRGDTYATYISLSPDTVIFFDIFFDKQTPRPDSYALYDQILSTFHFTN